MTTPTPDQALNNINEISTTTTDLFKNIDQLEQELLSEREKNKTITITMNTDHASFDARIV